MAYLSLFLELPKVPQVAVRQVLHSLWSNVRISKFGKKSLCVRTSFLQTTVGTSLSCTNELFGACYIC